MPTGYTSNIKNDISFEDFVLGCARAFGACMHQRDEDNKAKPKLRDEDSGYHINKLSEAKKHLAELQAMVGVNDRTKYGKKAIAEEEASNQEAFNEKVMLRNKYEAMLQKVYNWHSPTPNHEQLKEFMVGQITSSIEFDCDADYNMKRLTQLSKENPLDKYNDALRRAISDVEYHELELINERERNADANKWISALYDSLGIEYQNN
jgi:hypothetical protein